MRKAFIRTLVDLAEEDDRILLLTGDLGYTVIEPFAERFPRRFFNVGVAEQNLVGMATGLAESGFIPFLYSIATFAALRAYEFIRNGPVAHGLPGAPLTVRQDPGWSCDWKLFQRGAGGTADVPVKAYYALGGPGTLQARVVRSVSGSPWWLTATGPLPHLSS